MGKVRTRKTSADALEQPATSSAPASNPLENAVSPGLLRRLAIMTYDLLLLIGVVVLAATLAVIPIQTLIGINLSEGLPRLGFQLYVLLVIALYYLYFWTHGRETLGMRTWRVGLYREDGRDLGFADALRRLLFATLTVIPAGIGLFWVLFDRDGRSWYDRLSGTQLVLRRKPTKSRH